MSLVETIRKTFVPIHREGWPFIAAFAGATLLLGLFSTSLFWIGLILTAWCAYFFRDPERVTPVDDRLVISPADGVVSAVGPAVPPRELGLGIDEMTRISVFMNVFSCHVNRVAGARQDHPDRASARQIPQRRTRQGERARTSATAWSSKARTAPSPPSRSPGWWRGASSAGSRPRSEYRRRRALRPDPLRLARRRLPAAGRGAARGRRPDRGRRRDRDRRVRRQCRRRRWCGSRRR